MAIRLVQLTDLHLFAEPAQRLRGVPPQEAFLHTWRALLERTADFDRLVITGDLTHHGEAETYHLLRGLLGEKVDRTLVIPGNHDDPKTMASVFGMTVHDSRSGVAWSEPLGDWRIIGLDTHLPGTAAGRLSDHQLDWLREELANGDRPTIIAMHHPPLAVGSRWLDEIGLENASQFVDLIESCDHVPLVICGHVHQEFEGRIGATRVVTTPSAVIQFRPRTEEPDFVATPAGYRVLTLDEGDVNTEIVWLDDVPFPPSG